MTAKKTPAPTHYTVTLSAGHTDRKTGLTLPAGQSVVAAAIAEAIPAAIQTAPKTPVEV